MYRHSRPFDLKDSRRNDRIGFEGDSPGVAVGRNLVGWLTRHPSGTASKRCAANSTNAVCAFWRLRKRARPATAASRPWLGPPASPGARSGAGLRIWISRLCLRGQVRRSGSGRKPIQEKDPTLLADLRRLVEPATLGDPMRPLLWVSKSHAKLSYGLCAMGHSIS